MARPDGRGSGSDPEGDRQAGCSLVAVPALRDLELPVAHAVDLPMLAGNSPGPEIGPVALERLGLADPAKRRAKNDANQRFDALGDLRVLLLPPAIVLERRRGARRWRSYSSTNAALPRDNAFAPTCFFAVVDPGARLLPMRRPAWSGGIDVESSPGIP